MATIVCRHRNHTIFDRLSDNYSRSHAFYCTGVGENKKLESIIVEPSTFHAWPEYDEKKETLSLRWYQAKKKGLESPHKVVRDVQLNENTFISLCGHICNTQDYEETGELFDVTQVLSDIASQQPKPGNSHSHGSPKPKMNVLHWEEIPSALCFNVCVGRDFDFGFIHRKYSKYHREGLGNNIDHMRGIYCPFVENGFYENINFYEENAVWYNPGKKFVQINHAVTQENFFDKDGYLCSAWNYQHVTEEEVQKYYKMFLFLI